VRACIAATFEDLGSTRPLDVYLAVLGMAGSQVKIDKALVGDTSLGCHTFELQNNILSEAHG